MPSPTLAAAPGGRLGWLDGLRGVAALTVVFDHLMYTAAVLKPIREVISQWTALGQFGVFLFFLVSGYIVPASLEQKGSVRTFWVSRAFRLYPAYALASAALVILALAHLGSLAGAAAQPVPALLGHLLMMPNLLGAANVPYTVWTLSYEMVFYLLVTALFVARAHRRSGSHALCFAVAALALGTLLPTAAVSATSLGVTGVDVAADALVLAGLALAISPNRRLRVIGASAAAATALVLTLFNEPSFTAPWQALTILALMFTGTLLYRAEHGQVARWRAAAVTAAAFVLIAGAILDQGLAAGKLSLAALLSGERTWLTSVALALAVFLAGLALRHRPTPAGLTWLGLVSYSVYLLHPLLLGIYSDTAWSTTRLPAVIQAALAASLVAAVLVCSALAHRFVEAPAQRLGRQLNRYLDRRSAPPGPQPAPLRFRPTLILAPAASPAGSEPASGAAPSLHSAPMEKRILGRTGRAVSVVGLGTWQLGADWGDVGEKEALAVLDAAAGSGITFLDTADVYGDGRSERLIGQFLAANPGAEFTVATKMGRRVAQDPGLFTLDNFRAWTDRSRANLGTDRLDLVQLHCPPTPVYSSDAVYDALDTLVAEERIAAYGVSVETCAEALTAIARPGTASVQIILNAFRRKPLDEVLPAARAAGVGIIARVPLASGLLSGRYTHETILRRRRPPHLQPARRGVRRRGDVLRRGLRHRRGRGPRVRRTGAGRRHPGAGRTPLGNPAARRHRP